MISKSIPSQYIQYSIRITVKCSEYQTEHQLVGSSQSERAANKRQKHMHEGQARRAMASRSQQTQDSDGEGSSGAISESSLSVLRVGLSLRSRLLSQLSSFSFLLQSQDVGERCFVFVVFVVFEHGLIARSENLPD